MRSLIFGLFLCFQLLAQQAIQGREQLVETKDFAKKNIYEMEAFSNCKDMDEAAQKACVQEAYEGLTDEDKELVRLWEEQNYEYKKLSKDQETLQNFLSDRLEKELYGALINEEGQSESEKKKWRTVDHDVYYRLYESQMTKSITLLFSSFCMDIDKLNKEDKDLYSIPEDASKLADVRKTNIGLLKDQSAGTYYAQCIQSVSPLCLEKSKNPNALSERKNLFKRACAVSYNLKKLRQKLMQIQGTKQKIDEYAKRQGGAKGQVDFDLNDNEMFTGLGSDEKHYIDKITTVTSLDIQNSGFEKNLEQDRETIEKCKQNPDSSDCDQLLGVNEGADEDKDKKLLDDLEYRQNITSEKLSRLNDPAELKKFLELEGRVDEANLVETLTQDKLDELRTKIKKEYENEKDSIIEELRAKLGRDKDNELIESQASALDKVEKEISTKENLKQLVYFNNIISGYLSLESNEPAADDNSGRSTASVKVDGSQAKRYNINVMAKELENSAFSDENLSENAQGQQNIYNFEEIQEKLKELEASNEAATGDPSGGQSEESIGFDRKTINDQILGRRVDDP